MDLFVSGSLAYDRIMDFPGHFADHILPDKIHVLNVCFNINGVVEKFGGTAGNIAYTLSLLGERPRIVAAAGSDFDRYERWLVENGLSCSHIRKVDDVPTAGAYITTDLADNQITAFNPGAMLYPAELPDWNAPSDDVLIHIGPGNKQDMTAFAEKARRTGASFIFDPGQSLNIWTGEELRDVVRGALCFISNDYELTHFLKMTGWKIQQLFEHVRLVITTHGPEGSVLNVRGDKTLVPASKVKDVVDPTGAGDAYRAGLLKGLVNRFDWLTCCQMGSVAATYAVECHGTQEHRFDWGGFLARYESNFGPLSPDLLPEAPTGREASARGAA